MSLFALAPGGVRSTPLIAELADLDAAPPTRPPQKVQVSSDTNGKFGLVSFTVTLTPNFCPAQASAERCDLGNSYSLYFARSDGGRHGEALAKISADQDSTFEIIDVEVPQDITGITVRSGNTHGEIGYGPQVRFSDNKTVTLAPWRNAVVFASVKQQGEQDPIIKWTPFPWGGQDFQRMQSEDIRAPTAIAVGSLGRTIAFGRDTGSIVIYNAHFEQVVRVIEGRFAVRCLAYDDRTGGSGSPRVARGGAGGSLSVWGATTDNGNLLADLGGHQQDVVSLQVSWDEQRLASASSDKTVRLWDLSKASQLQILVGHEGVVHALAIDWQRQRVLTAAADESLRLFDAASGVQLESFEGHNEAVNWVKADWNVGRALSASVDGTIKFWDLATRECIRTFSLPAEAKGWFIASMQVNWASMQAMIVVQDGSAILFDLDGSSRDMIEKHSQEFSVATSWTEL